MLKKLQTAYENSLKNVVFVNFSNKSVVGEMKDMDISETELSKEVACCEDVITAINWHLREGDYSSVRERIATLEKSVAKIERLENQIKAQCCNNLYEIASQLCNQGKLAKVVKLSANPS